MFGLKYRRVQGYLVGGEEGGEEREERRREGRGGEMGRWERRGSPEEWAGCNLKQPWRQVGHQVSKGFQDRAVC